MAHGQWVKLLRQVAARLGRAPEASPKLTYNSMRRFLPTAANVMGFSLDVAQAIGSWQEIPQGEGSKGVAVRAMSLHYSDEQALASGAAKQRVLELFVERSAQHPTVAAILRGEPGHLEPGALPWSALASGGPEGRQGGPLRHHAQEGERPMKEEAKLKRTKEKKKKDNGKKRDRAKEPKEPKEDKDGKGKKKHRRQATS